MDLEFIDPATGAAVDQNHGGASFVLDGLSCTACHTAAASEEFVPSEPGGFPAGAMETLTRQRGGIVAPTPLPPNGG